MLINNSQIVGGLIAVVVIGCLTLSWPQTELYCEHKNTREEYCTVGHLPAVLAWEAGDALEARAEAVTALFTVVLAFSTIALWMATRKLWEAGERQISLNEATAEKQLRAYVGLAGVILDAPHLRAKQYAPPELIAGTVISDTLTLTLKNFGSTPANNVSIWVNWANTQHGHRLRNDFDFPDNNSFKGLDVDNKPSKSTIFPGQCLTLNAVITDLTPFREAVRHECNLYVWGHIDYEDIYGASKITTFCYDYAPHRAADDQFVPSPLNNRST